MTHGFRALALAAALASGCGASTSEQTTESPDDLLPADRPTHPASDLVARGERALAAGEAEEAERLFRQAVVEEPDDPRAHLHLGLTLDVRGQSEEAEAEYRRALDLDPSLAEAASNVAVIRLEADDLETAEVFARRAIVADASVVEAHANLAMILEAGGRAEEAIAEWQAVLARRPRDLAARTSLGLRLVDLQRMDDARRELERALAEAGEDTDVAILDALGAGLRRAGRPALAVRAIRLALAYEATATRFTELALAAAAAEQGSDAEAALRQAIAADADFAPAHYYLGRMLATRGAHDEARGELERARALDPDGPTGERAARALTELPAGGEGRRGRPRN